MPADWIPLQSSNLSACAYDEATQTLQVRFQSGRTYTLTSVPKDVAQGLADASSPGAYYANELKGQYPGG